MNFVGVLLIQAQMRAGGEGSLHPQDEKNEEKDEYNVIDTKINVDYVIVQNAKMHVPIVAQ
ncbi:hypothetical protein CR513_52948, partial [Mucuna pruriens]